MTMLRWIRLAGRALAGATLVATALLWVAAAPADAAVGGVCKLLPVLCPPATTAPTAAATATTKAPATTAPPAHSTATSGASKRAATTATAAPASRVATAVPAIGAGVLPPELPGLVTEPDSAAPELAPPPASAVASTATPAQAPAPSALSGLVGHTSGLPSDHPSLRIALSVLVLLVAGVALAQLPESRRLPRPQPPDPA